ncbi:hypothetical protein Afil01_24430 [Actinorhabdospora filicis]|uniref:DUF1990 domain-containing protein n=1 Tax=Actinorhabdospora filicis TaxID=1785913 RepID=A0A9W6SN63_9ACTN|nr:DUF1990 domain-containing protein [Actinorhabdospora filicis]GLZ77636.1 hypothetical protein Afil01_24430 [Actinorhabdospora filicis]
MDFTYGPQGVTNAPDPPARMRALRFETVLDVPFKAAREALFAWGAHRALRHKVTGPVAVGAEITQYFGPFRAPCRVVWVKNGPRAAGFAYGTLEGHPEIGEESFFVRETPDGCTRFSINAYSRPGRWYVRWGSPVARFVQKRITRKYARSLLAAAREL